MLQKYAGDLAEEGSGPQNGDSHYFVHSSTMDGIHFEYLRARYPPCLGISLGIWILVLLLLCSPLHWLHPELTLGKRPFFLQEIVLSDRCSVDFFPLSAYHVSMQGILFGY